MKVLVVESPNKVSKLQGFANALYGPGSIRVVATVGHWRGLPAMNGQRFDEVVNVTSWDEHFEVHKADVASRLGSAFKSATEVLLASDADREGEAIAWHIVDEFGLRGAKRVLLTEITKPALKAAIERAGVLDEHLAQAQRARQVLDYEIGMEVSRRLWRFGAKSAGRVQSAALRIVVDRELAIQAFMPEAYWTVSAKYKEGFTASVATFEAPKDEDLDDKGEGADATPKLTLKRFASQADADKLVDEVDA